MKYDPAGTTPGLSPGAKVLPKIHNMKCAKCESLEATEINLSEGPVPANSAPSQRAYRCVKCGNIRYLAVGGGVVL